MRGIVWLAASAMCLGFTGGRPVRADEARAPELGATLRSGTSVGYSEIGHGEVATLGGHVALGYRFGRIAIEAEASQLAMREYTGLDNRHRGSLRRYGVVGRLHALRIGRGEDPDSQLWIVLEAGFGRQLGQWDPQADGEMGLGFARNDTMVGGGWLLEHRFRGRPGGLAIDYVGWDFDWQFTAARGDGTVGASTARVVCRCRRPPPMPAADVDVGLAVSSSLSLRW